MSSFETDSKNFAKNPSELPEFTVVHCNDDDFSRTDVWFKLIVRFDGEVFVAHSRNKNRIENIRTYNEALEIFGNVQNNREDGFYHCKNNGAYRLEIGEDETPETRITMILGSDSSLHVHDFCYELPICFEES